MRLLSAFIAIVLLSLPVCGEEQVRSSRALNRTCNDNRQGIPFEISGTVVLPRTIPQGYFTLQSEGELVTLVDMRTNLSSSADSDTRMGDRVIACGHTEPSLSKLKTIACCYSMKVTTNGTLAVMAPISLHDFLARKNTDSPIVTLQGRLQDVFPDDIDIRYIYAVLNDGKDSAYLVCNCPRSWLQGFRSLLGREVIVMGVVLDREGNKPRYLGPKLRIAGTNAFRVVSRPTDYPFNVPEFVTDDATDPNVLTKLGPRIMRGTVLATWGRESFLLKTTAGRAVCVDLIEGPLPRVHATVEVVGRVETDLCDFALARASWRAIEIPTADEATARATPLKSLFTNGRLDYASIEINAHGKTLNVRGTIKSVSRGEDGSRKLLLADGEYSIPVICGPGRWGKPPPEEGWRVAVTGVCVKDSDVWRPTVPIPKIRGLFLVTRTNEDIVVLQRTPWWTPERLATAIAVLLAVLVAIFIWNVTLRILIDRRSREVIRAQTAKIASELRIDERTRLAADLHDSTVQNLTAIAYRITAAQGALGDRESEAGRILQVAAKMLKSCRTSLRQCLWDLRNDALNEPDFETAIRRTVETVAGDAKLSIRFAGRRNLINDSCAHAILNILRELVSNATVHGEASAVSIAGEARPEIIRFSVSDNGTGFDPAHRPGQDDGHFGLDGIQERLESLGGTLAIESSPGRGTYIRISISSAAPIHPTPQPLNLSTSQPLNFSTRT